MRGRAASQHMSTSTVRTAELPQDAAGAARWAALASFGAAVISLAVYLFTLAPTITWKHQGADSGDLATAAFTLGIPHPPGYPLFTLLASPFAHLPWLEAAAGVGVLAALAGALAVFVLARVGAELLTPLRQYPVVTVVPLLAALGFAFAPALWSQATIAEIYTLNLLLVAALLWAMVTTHPRRIQVAALALGLGMAHHFSILFILPGSWLMLRPARRDWRAVLLVAAPLLLYAYLPLRALAHPPVNWGNPGTPEGFLWEVTAAPYRSYFLAESLGDILSRVQFTARLLFDQFTPLGVAVSLWGLVRLASDRPRLAAALGLTAVLYVVYALLYVTRDSFVYLLPVFAICALWLIYGAGDLISHISRPPARWALAGALALLPVYNLIANYAAMDLSADREAYSFAQDVVDHAPADAVIFAEGDDSLFALTYFRYVIARRTSRAVVVSQAMLNFDWYYQEIRYAAPGLALAADLGPAAGQRTEGLIRAGLATGRPVCFTPSSDPPAGFAYEVRGTLHCAAEAK